MQIENLEKSDVSALETKLKELQMVNPDINFKTFPMEELEKKKTENEKLQLIIDKIEALERKLDLIFGGHVLMDGAFCKL